MKSLMPLIIVILFISNTAVAETGSENLTVIKSDSKSALSILKDGYAIDSVESFVDGKFIFFQGENHSVTIKKIGENGIEVLIMSKPVYLNLDTSELALVDLDGDG